MAITHQPHTVYLRSVWSADWAAVPYLYANNFILAVAPSTQSASLQYDYGRKVRAGTGDVADFPPLDIIGQYVKVEVNDGPAWYGIVIDEDDQRGGVAIYDGNQVRTGSQTFICRGLEYLLQRDPIVTSQVFDAAGNEQTIGRAIGFNLGAGLPSSAFRQGNASTAPGGSGTAIFAGDLEDAGEWTAKQILEYLLAYHFPQNQGDADVMGWEMSDSSMQYLVALKPAMQVHGKTIFQVLNEICDRRRLLSWRIDVVDNKPTVVVFSFNREPIFLPDGTIIVENQNQVNWNFDSSNLIQPCVLTTDATSFYDQVIVRGEPPGSVFTVEMSGGGGNGLLDTDWSTGQQAAYDAGATGDAGYAAMDSWAKHNANQVARSRDEVRKVYRYFRLHPTNFTGTIGGNPVWPYDSGANANVPLSFWLPGIRLQDYIPLKIEHDYTNPETITNQMKAGSKWEYRRPFAYMLDNDSGRYFMLDRPGRGESIETQLQAGGRPWAAHIRMQDDAPGIVVDVAGFPQHVIAKNTFTSADADDATDYEPDSDFNYLAATVFAEGDGQVEVRYPDNVLGNVEAVKRLHIYAPNCRRDYIPPGTVIDLDDEGGKITSAGGFIQDDTEYMGCIARAAHEWYSTPRKAMQVSLHNLAYVLATNVLINLPETIYLGTLIRTVGDGANLEQINSVVSAMQIDLLAGATVYTTQFAELDLA